MTNSIFARTHLTHPRVFTVDALLSATLGLLLMVAAEQIADVAGGGLSGDGLRWVGGFLLPWAYYNWHIAKQPTVEPHALIIHILGDFGWILGSFYLLIRDCSEFTEWGWVLYGPQTMTVLAIVLAKIATSSVLRTTF
jgi:hypothetical protein